jgi:hypothetical protein
MEKKEKKVGRPRKKDKPELQLEKLGIVDMSNEPDEIIFIMLYDKPAIFKKIFHTIDVMKTDLIQLKIEKQKLKLTCEDHSQNSSIYIEIYGREMNKYYCHKELSFQLVPANMQNIFKFLDSTINQVIWRITETRRSFELSIEFIDNINYSAKKYLVNIMPDIELAKWPIEHKAETESTYPICFELPFGTLKKIIASTNRFASKLKIEKYGTDDTLILSHDLASGGTSTTKFENPSYIKLRSELTAEQMFIMEVNINVLKVVTSSVLGDYVCVAAKELTGLICSFCLDEREEAKKRILHSEIGIAKIFIEEANSKQSS